MTDRPPRVVMATARYLPEHGGTEIHVHEVAQRLAHRGAEVTVATTSLERSFAAETREGRVRVVRVRAWPAHRDYYLAPGLARVIRREAPDLVHCQGYHTLVAPLVMLTCRAARIPYVVTLHSGGHSSSVRRMLRPVQAWLLRALLLGARRLIATTDFEAELFTARLRVPPATFTVIPSGVDLPVPSPRPAPADPPLVLSLGRLEAYKGHGRVVEALPTLARRHPGLRLRLVGSGPGEAELRALAAELGVSGLVEIAPIEAGARQEMATLLLRAAVVVSLSEYESQGLAVQEALALGRPLVIAGGSALADLERHANVRTVTPDAGPEEVAEAIAGLVGAPPAAPPPMPTWDGCADALLALYSDVLAETRNSRSRAPAPPR